MLFNVDKHKILHLDHQNKMIPYVMKGIVLQAMQAEQYLSIVFQMDLKWAKQCANVVGEANTTSGLIKICLGSLTEDMILKLYAWRLRLQIFCLEKAQRSATKLTVLLRGKSYNERLEALN
jgi:hypothetical protein